MAGNPIDSKWRATPRALRNRKPLSVTLSDEAREKLETLARTAGEGGPPVTLSAMVESLIVEAYRAKPNRSVVTREVEHFASKPRGTIAQKTPTRDVGRTKRETKLHSTGGPKRR